MRKVVRVAVAMSGLLLLGVGQAWALSPETLMLLDLLKAKGVINQQDAEEFTRALEAKAPAASEEEDHHHGVQSLSDRVERLEGKTGALAEVSDRVRVSGLVEVAASTARTRDAAGHKQNSSDVTLSTAQLNADATVNPYVNGHLALLYEEDPQDSGNTTVGLDEAIVALNGGEAWPVYANIGRMYVPFGHFESHFVSDPLTLALGETNDTAVVAGFANELVDVNAGVMKAKVKEAGSSDHVNTVVASATLSLPAASKEGLAMTSGVSYLSTLAASDGLEAETTTAGEVADSVGGVSGFVSLAYGECFFFDAEYLGALEGFRTGDLSFVDAHNRRPSAWNLEAAAKITPGTEFALRYGGSDQAGNFLAENEYGAAVLYELFADTSLTIEYLFQEFQDAVNNSQATMQLAVEF
jgi:hypothetical protein